MKRHYYLLVLIILSGCNMNSSSATNLANCDKIYQAIEQDAALGTPLQKAQAMQEQGKSCLGTGMYDVWLASYYQDAGEYQTSVKIVQSALDKIKTEEARPNLLQLLAEAELKTGDEAKAIQMAEAISNDYPTYSPIKYFLFDVAIKNNRLSEALAHMEDVYKQDKNALSLLGMATVLHQLSRHEETANVVYKALEMEPERIANITGVLEAIFSLAILNRRTEATELAKKHIAANPNWRDNPTFVQAARELGVTEQVR